MARKRETGKTPRKPKKRVSDAELQRLAVGTLVNAERIGAEVTRREYLTALAAGLLPSAWLARSSSNGGHA